MIDIPVKTADSERDREPAHPRRPTVLHVIDTTGPGGAESVFVELADRMREQGFRSVVVLRGSGWVRDTLVERGLDPILIDAKGSFNWRYLTKLVKLIRRHDIELIHSHLLGSNVYCALAGWLTGKPVVATFHGLVDVRPNERLRNLKFWLMQRAVRRYVAVSNSLARAIQEAGLLDPSRAAVIYNGVELERFDRPRHRRLVQQLGLREDAVLVGSLGNVRPAKAYDVLIQAASLLCRRDPRVHFVVAGHIKADVMEPLQRMLDEHKLNERVFFLGFCSDTVEFLTGVDVFALSSRSEGFSISTVEAQAAGLPVVATRSGGPEEIVEHESTGLLVPVGSPEALGDALERVIGDRRLAEAFSVEGRRSAAHRFSMAAMLRAYRALYASILDADVIETRADEHTA